MNLGGMNCSSPQYGGKIMKLRMSDNLLAYLLLLPASVVLFFVLLFPIFSTLLQSFGIGFDSYNFTFANYTRLLSDVDFWQSLKNTVLFVAFSISGDLLIGLGAALLLNQAIRGKAFFRVLFMLPWMIPSVVTGATWKWMYNTTSGIINSVLLYIGLIDKPVLWLSMQSTAMFSIIIANIWRGFPYVMLILLAGLQTIPHSIYEAGSIDGASAVERFFYLTLPNLKKQIVIVLALTTVWEFRQIDLVMTMTGGGPGNLTDVLVTNVYKQYFQFFQFDYASAIAILMSVFMLIVSIPYIKSILKD
jgi:multiple sugar transport system permease protein